MIKEPPKKTKYNEKKTMRQILLEYARTMLISVLIAAVITTMLSIRAREAMIKNLYANPAAQRSLDKKLALQFISTNSGLLEDLENKRFSVCLNVGSLYETAGEYEIARRAYEIAMSKAKPNNFDAHYKLICVLLELNKFKEANDIIKGVDDYNSKNLIRFKSRSYIVMGDKYYSIGKFITASKNYEKARFYYNKFTKKQDKVVVESINERILNAYINAADELVKMGKNSEAYVYLKKAEKMAPNNLKIKYKLAIVLSDLDPEKSVEYLDILLDKAPQEIDYEIFGKALMKAATIADLDERPTQAKYYRYKIHSIDLFINRKVIYKNDVDVIIDPTPVKKRFFTYPVKLKYSFINNSNSDLYQIKADFVLSGEDKEPETITQVIANKEHPLLCGYSVPTETEVKFKKKVFTKKDLESYTVRIYLYKDDKFKTLVAETKIPVK